LEQLHWSSTRTRVFDEVLAFAFDHRKQLEDMLTGTSKNAEAISAFKLLCLKAFEQVKAQHTDRGLGILCDGRLGQAALDKASGNDTWIGRPIEYPGSRPLQFEGGSSVMETLREWPLEHCVKCLTFYHPDDASELKQEQEAALLRLAAAARATRHELLVEVIPPATLPRSAATISSVIERLYDIGIYPDWWKLPTPVDHEEWKRLTALVNQRDPHCRGIVLLGLDAPEVDVIAAIQAAAHYPICKGFAVGRTIFGEAARAWFADEKSDEVVIQEMADRYSRLIDCWISAREGSDVQEQQKVKA
jgi:5-dehydro-2-deoxygluconokinase